MKIDNYYEYRFPEKTWEKVKDKISWGNKTVMDVGCYYGWFLFATIDVGAEKATGIDLNVYQNPIKQKEYMKMFDVIKQEMEKRNLTKAIQLIEGDWLDIEAPKADIVLCMNAAHYFSDIKEGIKKLFEHAKEYVVFETNLVTSHKDFKLVFETPSHWNCRKIRIFKRINENEI